MNKKKDPIKKKTSNKADFYFAYMFAAAILLILAKIIYTYNLRNSEFFIGLSLFILVFAFWKTKLLKKYKEVEEKEQEIAQAENEDFVYKLYSSMNFNIAQIMAGNKTVFSSGKIFYAIKGLDLPRINYIDTLSNELAQPLLDIEFINVREIAYKYIDQELAELEGFASLEDWQKYKTEVLNYQLSEIYLSQQQDSGTQLFGSNSVGINIQQSYAMELAKNDVRNGISEGEITSNFLLIFEYFQLHKIYPMNYQQWLDFASQTLTETAALQDPYLDPKADAQLLLQAVTERSKASILAFAETELEQKTLEKLSALLVRRAQGEPMAYILGEKEFWSLSLMVSPATLIPRPDTEVLVEKTLELIEKKIQQPEFDGNLRILDLGTGTGAIALALASELQKIQKKSGIKFQIFALDKEAEAVVLAQRNAERHQLPIEVLQSHWFSALDPQLKFDLIVSNPPYIDAQDPHLKQGDVRFEPRSALVAPEQGYADLEQIIQQAPAYLKAQGWLILEHGWQQAQGVQGRFAQAGWQQIETALDYGAQPRITFACTTFTRME